MSHVLCIDTEPETAQAIRSAKHEVAEGDIGLGQAVPTCRIRLTNMTW